jgi:hypothetical protein
MDNMVDATQVRARYLELMRDSLIGLIDEDPALEIRPRGGRLPFDSAKRLEGQDWPASALSMIGARRMYQLQQAVEYVVGRGVPGDLIETGVWRGGACILMRAVLMAYGVRDRRVWVADSFAGLPAPDPARYPSDRGIRFHTFEQLAVPLDQVRRNFERYRLLDDQVVFLKGWFRDTLHAAPIDRLAVLRLDGDLYESTMDALANLYHRVSPGGFVIIDDYQEIAACDAAVHDFRGAHGISEPIQKLEAVGAWWRKEA